MNTTTMNKTTFAAMLLAVAALATGCHKADNNPNTGPAQEAGKAIDDAGAKVATEARQGAAEANAAADRAGERIDAATDRAGAKIDAATDRAAEKTREAGAEVRQESREAAQNVKEGASNATAATGRAVERAGEKIQDAAK